MTQLTNPQPAKQAAARAFCLFNLISFVVGAKLTNTINVTLQLQDARGQPIAQIGSFRFYLSANSDGHSLSGTATTSALAIGTNGVLLDILVTGLAGWVITNAAGQADLNLIQTAGGTNYYLVVEMPDGSIVVSPEISF